MLLIESNLVFYRNNVPWNETRFKYIHKRPSKSSETANKKDYFQFCRITLFKISIIRLNLFGIISKFFCKVLFLIFLVGVKEIFLHRAKYNLLFRIHKSIEWFELNKNCAFFKHFLNFWKQIIIIVDAFLKLDLFWCWISVEVLFISSLALRMKAKDIYRKFRCILLDFLEIRL